MEKGVFAVAVLHRGEGFLKAVLPLTAAVRLKKAALNRESILAGRGLPKG
jgi:hypothetical protein